jgi:hypothetical protein
MKKTIIVVTLLFIAATTNSNAKSFKKDVSYETCDDYAFRQVELYYDHGNDDNFEAGTLFYVSMWLCETMNRYN